MIAQEQMDHVRVLVQLGVVQSCLLVLVLCHLVWFELEKQAYHWDVIALGSNYQRSLPHFILRMGQEPVIEESILHFVQPVPLYIHEKLIWACSWVWLVCRFHICQVFTWLDLIAFDILSNCDYLAYPLLPDTLLRVIIRSLLLGISVCLFLKCSGFP